MNDQSLPYNVVLLPTQDLAEKAMVLSNQLADGTSLFTLKDGEFFPHVSLYMLQLKQSDTSRVQQLLHGTAEMSHAFDLVATKYDQTKGFLDVEYEKTPALSQLQDQVLAVLNPLRNGMREKDKARMQEAMGKKLEYFEQYGWPNVHELYRPHMTITRFNHEEGVDTSNLPDPTTFAGTFDRIGFFEMGDNGTCVKKVAEFELQ